jgi:hypothetical protein
MKNMHFSRADAKGQADLFGIKVVVNNALDDGGEVGIHEGVAGLLKAGDELAKQEAQLKEESMSLGLTKMIRRQTTKIF